MLMTTSKSSSFLTCKWATNFVLFSPVFKRTWSRLWLFFPSYSSSSFLPNNGHSLKICIAIFFPTFAFAEVGTKTGKITHVKRNIFQAPQSLSFLLWHHRLITNKSKAEKRPFFSCQDHNGSKSLWIVSYCQHCERSEQRLAWNLG